MKVKKINYNWRQVGSITDRDGAGEDYSTFEVGQKGVIEIQEQPLSYLIILEDSVVRVFNPNYVEYIKE